MEGRRVRRFKATPKFSGHGSPYGVGFGLTLLFSISLILIWELGRALNLFHGSFFIDLSLDFPPPSAPQSPTLPISSLPQWFQFLFMNWVMLSLLQGLIESSECVQMEYVAVFVAFLFPGALVAFDSESLQPLSCFAALRIYCAGIWHNAVCCAVCGLALLLCPSSCFRSTYMVKVPWFWVYHLCRLCLVTCLLAMGRNHSLDVQGFGINRIKGYCVPNSMMEENHNHPSRIEKTHCLNAKNVVKLNKCGEGWAAITNGSNCMCSQEESCLSPVQIPGLIWVEITYSRPYSLECLRVRRKSFVGPRISDSMESNCGGTFVFVGDVISMARSVKLTAYRPRWAFPLGVLSGWRINFRGDSFPLRFAVPKEEKESSSSLPFIGDTNFHPRLLQDHVIYFVSESDLCS
ncbi:membrane-bound transcription factor site-2 protease homolog isoform X2 [Prunus yedoensis var. nudiflora]|uniref:Membrane-bound transcription factor site-2 protease homolog isoform X2 n=1 Tax=Prunus yedoensis var. nudiflora TaxID=2094558 RepID=A0A315AWZ2_PRUYE|nr:membrane-bound transcription factor site-2 protease homolog isoform X2 [Prunus yedoensis var. nudiflora]